jgi:transcriptional regulator with XRE-family HTH domain
MDVRQLVGWNLRRLRVMRGISQDELALQADVERAYVGHLERGTKNATLLTIEKLAVELFREPDAGQVKPEPLRAGRRKAR